MKSSRCLLKATGSSARWLTRQQNDPFVRARAGVSAVGGDQPANRSRAGFKLASLAKRHPRILPQGGTIVDLGAAPGGWSQVAQRAVGPRGKVIAMDLLPFAPLKGVTFLQGDFLSPSVQQQLFHLLMPSSSEGKQSSGHSPGLVDSVISDMMANMSGIRSRDVENSLSLCEAALSFAIAVLKTRTSTVAGTASSTPGGTLVLKHFQHPLLEQFKKEQLDPRFARVCFEKPKESRKESSEAYYVCLGYKGDDQT